MGIASAASAGLGLVGGIYNTIQGAKQAREAENALENYNRQQLSNVAEGLQVSTLGSDLQREEQSRLASGQIGALRESGTRGLIGGLGRVSQANQMVNRQIGADLDMQQKQIDQMRAEDEARIRAMQENREQNDINALSSQINAGRQGQATGISQGIQGISMIGNAFSPQTSQGAYQYRNSQPIDNSLQPVGIQSQPQQIQTSPYPTSRFGQLGQGMFAQPNPYTTQQ